MARTWKTPAISKVNTGSGSYWVKDAEVRAILDTYAATNCAAEKQFTTDAPSSASTDGTLPTSKAVWTAIAAVPKLTYQVFTTLPTPSAAYKNVIGLVKDSTSTSGSYIEYLCMEPDPGCDSYRWEKIGTTATDLSGYAKWGTYTGTATTSVTVPSGATGSSGGATVDFTKAGFSGTSTTISTTLTDYVTGINTSGAETGTVHDVTDAVASAPTFKGAAKTFTINFNDECEASSLADMFVTGINTTSSTDKETITYVESASVSSASFNGTAATIKTDINSGTNKDVVTGLTTTAVTTSTKTFVKSVGVNASQTKFTGTKSTISVYGYGGSHTHEIPLTTDSIAVLDSYTPASWSASVSNEELSFSFAGGSAHTKYHTYYKNIGGDDCDTAVTAAASVGLTSTGEYTPAGSISVTLAPTTESITYAPSGISTVSASYTTKTLSANSYTPAGTVSVSLSAPTTTATFVKSAIGAVTPAYAEKTLIINYLPTGTVTAPSINLTSSTKTFVSSVSGITLSKSSKSVSASYTPAGSITGNQTIAAHTHTVQTTTSNFTGTVSVNVQSA